MFLPVNMCKICKQFFNSYYKWCIWKQSLRVLLKIVILFYMYLGSSLGGVHFQQSCRYYVCRFGGVGSVVGVSQVFYLLCELLFLGNCPQWLVHDFKYTFHFNLHGRKALWRVLFTCIFLINIWYCISCLLNINTQVGNLQSFPSQTTNLLTQCFY